MALQRSAVKRGREVKGGGFILKIDPSPFPKDIRPKAASEIELAHASRLLGHSTEEMTKKVYRRVGEIVKPTK